MDFRTGDVTANAYVRGTSLSVPSAWNQGFSTTGEHTTGLPQKATKVTNCPDDGCALNERLTARPFFKPAPGELLWSIGHEGVWACDDSPPAPHDQFTTLHQVWVRDLPR
jgi:hypothetical protein